MNCILDNASSSLSTSPQHRQKDIITNIKQQHKIDGANSDSDTVIANDDEHDHHDDAETHYHSALKFKTPGDNGFGLDIRSSTIGGMPYTVHGNRLIVDVGTGSNKVFDIVDPDVWKWLIMKNPTLKLRAYKENGKPTPGFMGYARVAKSLRLLARAQHKAAKNGKTLTKTIPKYRLLLQSNRVCTPLQGCLEDTMTMHRSNPNILTMPGNKVALLEKRVEQLEAGARSTASIAVRNAKMPKRKPPFECAHCKSSFIYSGNLYNHMIRYHPREMDKIKLKRVECFHCGKLFCNNGNRSRHIKAETCRMFPLRR